MTRDVLYQHWARTISVLKAVPSKSECYRKPTIHQRRMHRPGSLLAQPCCSHVYASAASRAAAGQGQRCCGAPLHRLPEPHALCRAGPSTLPLPQRCHSRSQLRHMQPSCAQGSDDSQPSSSSYAAQRQQQSTRQRGPPDLTKADFSRGVPDWLSADEATESGRERCAVLLAHAK